MDKLIAVGEKEKKNNSVLTAVVVTSSVYIVVGWPRTILHVIANTI